MQSKMDEIELKIRGIFEGISDQILNGPTKDLGFHTLDTSNGVIFDEVSLTYEIDRESMTTKFVSLQRNSEHFCTVFPTSFR